jgi:hypothetical protein
MSYDGYLKPHLKQIGDLHAKGMNPNQIGLWLYDQGLRTSAPQIEGRLHYDREEMANSFAGLIRRILKLMPNALNMPVGDQANA